MFPVSQSLIDGHSAIGFVSNGSTTSLAYCLSIGQIQHYTFTHASTTLYLAKISGRFWEGDVDGVSNVDGFLEYAK